MMSRASAVKVTMILASLMSVWTSRAFIPAGTQTKASMRPNIFYASSLPRRCNPNLHLSAARKTADFEYQELKLQVKAMTEQGVSSSQLPVLKRIELLGYIQKVLQQRDSPIPPYEVSASKHLSGTSWRLAFMSGADGGSNGVDITSSLPPGTQIRLLFSSDTTMDYILDFKNVFALKRMTAKSQYQVDVSTFWFGDRAVYRLATYPFVHLFQRYAINSSLLQSHLDLFTSHTKTLPLMFLDFPILELGPLGC